MSAIKNVTVVGAFGTLGVPLVKALQEAGFHVTALSRAGSPSTPPAGVEVKKVDYASPEALQAALAGQDALVSVITTTATGEHEFGINTRTVPHPGLKAMLQSKIKLVDYLQEKSRENPNLTWTGICNSFFFDSIKRGSGFGFDLKTKKATIIDSGDEPFDVATLSFVAKAVVAVLSSPDKTANRYLAVSGTVTTQNQLLAILREETGGDWTTENVAATKCEEIGNEKMARGTTRPSGTSCTSCSSATARARPSRPPPTSSSASRGRMPGLPSKLSWQVYRSRLRKVALLS
ncbi:NmrA-like protein [Apiospora aurea]|uniref:NmrA-like protein n=1 Tax=Apiospora aurea TaxID=335848 RepID=A0ABR1PUY6_9PEZI